MTFTNNEFPTDMITYFKEGRSIFFVGAGISMEAGLPSWETLLKNLIAQAKSRPHMTAEKILDYEQLLNDPSNYLMVAEELRHDLGDSFEDYMQDVFGKPDITPTQTIKDILSINSSIVITSNYDRLIENAFITLKGYTPPTFTYNQSREIANNYWKQKLFILKAHGDAFQDVKGIIISQRDYRKTLYREFAYKSILQSIFSTKSILFLGTSMTDPEFNLLLDYLHDSYKGGGPEHFLLMEESNTSPIARKRFLEDYKINIITYKNDSGTHAEVGSYIEELKRRIQTT